MSSTEKTYQIWLGKVAFVVLHTRLKKNISVKPTLPDDDYFISL